MENSKKIALEIAKLFFVILFANWVVSLGDDKPFLAENPIRWIAIMLLVSVIGGYGQFRFIQYYENKSKQKKENG